MFRSRKQSPAEGPDIQEDMLVVVDQAVNPYLVMFHDPAGFRAEQVRSLRNKLMALNPDGGPKSLVVTSAIRAEGKSVSAINVALAFAELDSHRVILVDGDLRRPAVESYLNLAREPGLSDLLMGTAGLDRVVRSGGVRNLDVIGAGARVASPSEILSGPKIDDLYRRLKERYRYVIVDTPPVLTASDTGVLASQADGTLLVIRLEHSSKPHTKDAIRHLNDLGANVMGTFVTEVRGADPDADRRLTYDEAPED